MMLRMWHRALQMSKYTRQWHVDDIKEEMEEYRNAKGIFHRWSELSDVVYTHSRAQIYGGFTDVESPLSWLSYQIGKLYMYPKYTLRWKFYRKVGREFGKSITEVRNYKKEEKLRKIAQRYNIPEDQFIQSCKRHARYWIFLP